MSYIRKYFYKAQVLGLLALLTLSSLTPIASGQERMTPEQIVARHLESIGSVQARQRAGGRLVFGTCNVTFRGPRVGTLTGRAVLASQNTRTLIAAEFGSPDYPHEKLGFDGQNFTAGYITPGVRTVLGGFLLSNNAIFKEGLVGGALSSAWPLSDIPARGAQLSYEGTERINDRRVHKLRYNIRRSSDMQITLYFDAENFRHMRTRYERVIAAGIGASVDASARLRETRYRMVENFSEFRAERGLALPHRYELELFIDSTNGTIAYNYVFNLSQFSFNQEIGPEFFNAEGS